MKKIRLYSDVESMIKVMPRIETLYYFVYELAQCFHADQDTLQSIKDGILDNQILQRIVLEYINDDGKKIAEILIEIDWEKHVLFAQTESGRSIQIDMNKSVVDNIVGWKKYVVAHVDAIMNQYGANKVKSTYRYRHQITQNETIHQEAREILNHVPITTPTPIAINQTLQRELGNAFEKVTEDRIHGNTIKRSLDCGVLEEVHVEMEYKSKE